MRQATRGLERRSIGVTFLRTGCRGSNEGQALATARGPLQQVEGDSPSLFPYQSCNRLCDHDGCGPRARVSCSAVRKPGKGSNWDEVANLLRESSHTDSSVPGAFLTSISCQHSYLSARTCASSRGDMAVMSEVQCNDPQHSTQSRHTQHRYSSATTAHQAAQAVWTMRYGLQDMLPCCTRRRTGSKQHSFRCRPWGRRPGDH